MLDSCIGLVFSKPQCILLGWTCAAQEQSTWSTYIATNNRTLLENPAYSMYSECFSPREPCLHWVLSFTFYVEVGKMYCQKRLYFRWQYGSFLNLGCIFYQPPCDRWKFAGMAYWLIDISVKLIYRLFFKYRYRLIYKN